MMRHNSANYFNLYCTSYLRYITGIWIQYVIFVVGEDMIFGEGSEYMYPMTVAAAASACR
jgi:hypothetical protein